MKKILIAAIALVMALCVFAGCGASQKGDSAADYDYTAEDIAAVIREAYGEDYLANMPIDGAALSDMFGVDPADCESFVAEMPMISMHPDTLIVIEAKEGRADAVFEALTAARESIVSDTMQYPMNIAKINSSVVLREGNYVAFLLLGKYNDNMDATEEEAKTFAEEQTAIGVNAFEGMFK